PRKYHAPLVLCYLEGRTHEAAAEELGWPTGTVKGRLARARAMLRARLVRRGFPVALVGAVLAEGATAAVPPDLLQTGAEAALRGTAGTISGEVTALAEGVMNAMWMSKLKFGVLVVLVLGFLGTGAGLVSVRVLAAGREAPGAAGVQPSQPN